MDRALKRSFIRKALAVAPLVLFLGTLCGGSAHAVEKSIIFVSILPQVYFVDQIAGTRAEVSVMVPPGANPATYEPTPKQMAALSRCKIYFAIGVPFEKGWLSKIRSINPRMQLVHTDTGIQKRPMAADIYGKHAAARHGHRELDPHIWLSPPLVNIVAKNMLAALIASDPDAGNLYQNSFRAFTEEIDRLHTALQETFRSHAGAQFMVFHPSWGYFADTYGLRQVPIEIEGKNPKPAQLQRLITHAKKRGITVVFVQPQFSTRNAEVIAKAIGGKVIVADPLAPDWAENLKKQAGAFKSALR